MQLFSEYLPDFNALVEINDELLRNWFAYPNKSFPGFIVGAPKMLQIKVFYEREN